MAKFIMNGKKRKEIRDIRNIWYSNTKTADLRLAESHIKYLLYIVTNLDNKVNGLEDEKDELSKEKRHYSLEKHGLLKMLTNLENRLPSKGK